jgi:hypothetical protein
MTRSTQSEDKLEEFINKLESRVCRFKIDKRKPRIYFFNDERVNIRCRGKTKKIADGRGLWYSVSFNVLREVERVIYIGTSSDYFFMFPSSFLESLKDRMYSDKRNAGVGIFDIDYDSEMMVLKQGELISINEYYFNLIYQDDFPQFLDREKH